MPDNNKHKIFSKEELFRLLDEKRSLPPDADDFDKEALEGLSMVTDRKKLDTLNDSIDEVLKNEKAKASRKRNIYLFSAAASLLLIIGLFFLVKELSFDKKPESLAENTLINTGGAQPDEVKTTDEKVPDEKKPGDQRDEEPASAAAKGKEGKAESVTTVDAVTTVSSGEAMAAPPAEVAASPQVKQEISKMQNEESEARFDDKVAGGGKDNYKTQVAKEDAPQREALKKAEEKEKDKTRYETNTVWTSSAPSSGAGISSADQSVKTRSLEESRNKNQDDVDANAVAANNNAAPQKLAEVNEKQKSTGPSKKSKAKKEVAKPDTIVADMLAGYAYSTENKPNSGLVQGGPPQSPVHTESATTKAADIPVEEKAAQQVTSGNVVADEQNGEPKTTIRGGRSGEGDEFVGGEEALQKFVKGNLKISEPQKSGKIVAEFEVESDGKVDTGSVKITSKISNCNPCSDDVKRMVKKMPKWKPSSEKGSTRARKQKISVDYNIK